MKTLAVIGHSDSLLSKYDISKVRNYYFSQIESYSPGKVITCLKPGADMELAQVALEMQVPYDVYVPYKRYTYSFDKELKERYNSLLKQASSVNQTFDRFAPAKLKSFYSGIHSMTTGMIFVWDRSTGFVSQQIQSANRDNCLSLLDLITYEIINL